MTLYKLLYWISTFGGGIITWISLASSLLAVLGAISSKKKENVGSFRAWTILSITGIFVTITTLSGHMLVKIPDVTDIYYEDARRILVDSNLKYTVLPDTGLYVLEQNPSANEIVPQGTIVELTVGQTSSSKESIAYFESAINATDFGNLSVQFYESLVKVVDGADNLRCFGPDFSDFTVAEAYLLQNDYGVKYCDYSVENGLLTFEDVPTGVEFTLYILLDGYEEAKCDGIMLSSINMIDKIFRLHLGLTKDNLEYMPSSSFRVVDSDGRFLEDVNLLIKWSWSDIWHGDYSSNKDGCFPYVLWLDENQSLEVCVVDPFGDGTEYNCTVTLRKCQVGHIANDDVIVVSKNGNCYVVDEETYFGY